MADTSPRVLKALKVKSSRFPIGVATIYRSPEDLGTEFSPCITYLSRSKGKRKSWPTDLEDILVIGGSFLLNSEFLIRLIIFSTVSFLNPEAMMSFIGVLLSTS